MKTARVLVTGSSGFVGAHLMARLRASGVNAVGIDRAGPAAFRGDLQSDAFVAGVLKEVRPTIVVHLAGVLRDDPADAVTPYQENLLNTVRLLEAVRREGLAPRILVASSSAVYGDTAPHENPLAEDRTFRPLTAYAVTKVGQEMAALQYHLAYRLHTIRVRTFNLVGPGQPWHLLVSGLARQIALAERGTGPIVVRVGNLGPRRDYTDVRDAVRAYHLLAEHGEAGSVYNVCTGRSVSVQECIDTFSDLVGRPLIVERDEASARRLEIPDQAGDATRLRALTGWRPEIPFPHSVRDVLEDWRARVRAGQTVSPT